MALRTHNLPSGRLKKRLLWSRCSDFWRCRKAMQNHFLHPGHRKKRLERSRLNDVLSRRMDLGIHNLPSWNQKTSGEFDEAMFQGVVMPCDLIFYILGIENWLVCSRLCDFLSRRMALRTHYLPSDRLKMRLWWCLWSDVSWCRNGIRTHFLHSGNGKKQFCRSRGSDVLNRQMALRTHNLPSGSLKKRLT
jgi:hypothetical protein